MTRNRRYLLAAAAVLVASMAGRGADAPALKTPAEEAGWSAYSQGDAIAAFLSRAAALSPALKVRVAGRTDPVPEFPSREIPLCVLSRNGASAPADLDRSRPTLLVVAAQHGNEQSAKEAALGLVRDAALGGLRPLLDRVNILVMPQANPYGSAFDVRADEGGRDMNRDHVKLESAEVRAIHRVFRDWMPEATLDVHEKGDDYYRVSVGCVSNAAIHPSLQDYSRDVVLRAIEASLAASKVTFHEYLITEPMGSTEAAGVRDTAEVERREEMKRYSTTDLNDGRNGLGVYETLSFIQEGASRHDLATLAARTGWQSAGVRAWVEAIAARAGEARDLVRGLRARLLDRAAAPAPGDPVPLRMIYARDPAQPTLTLRAFERSAADVVGILKADMKAGAAVTEDDLAPNPAPRGRAVVTEVVKNWFPRVEVTASAPRARGYVVPADRGDVVATLLAHGVAVRLVTRDATIPVELTEIVRIQAAPSDWVAPAEIETRTRTQPGLVRAGDFYVDAAQPAANLVPALLEPASEFGLIRYRKYRLTVEPGGIFPILRAAAAPGLETVPYRGWD